MRTLQAERGFSLSPRAKSSLGLGMEFELPSMQNALGSVPSTVSPVVVAASREWSTSKVEAGALDGSLPGGKFLLLPLLFCFCYFLRGWVCVCVCAYFCFNRYILRRLVSQKQEYITP